MRPQYYDAAIIGAGFSGTLTAINLAHAAGPRYRIALIEKSGSFGPGLAYSGSQRPHLLNVVARKMGAFPEDEQHFGRWIGALDTFESRGRYGEYLAQLLRASDEDHPCIERFTGEALGLSRSPEGYVVRLNSGASIAAAQVVLAIGNLPPRPLAALGQVEHAAQRVLNDPWLVTQLERIPQDADVLVVGSGLTALDCLTALSAHCLRGVVHIVSRHGLFPRPNLRLDAAPDVSAAILGATTARDLVREFRRFVRECASIGVRWDSAVHALRPHLQRVWSGLAARERSRLMRHVKAFWEVHRHRAPVQIVAHKDALLARRQLRPHTARIHSIEARADGCRVLIARRGGSELREIQAGFVINCTGPESDYTRTENPLLANALASGLVRPGPLKMGLDATTDGRIIERSGVVASDLFTLGPPLKGVLYETTAVGEIREQAAALAELMLLPKRVERLLVGNNQR